jgi:hypothetical protein
MNLSAVLIASFLLAALVLPAAAQTAPAFLPNTAIPMVGYAGGHGTATDPFGSNISCTAGSGSGGAGSCTTWAAGGATGSNSSATWYNSTYNGNNTPLTTQVFLPTGLGYDSWGNFYWADRFLSLIREVPVSAPTTVVAVGGNVNPMAGSGTLTGPYNLVDCITGSATPVSTALGCLDGSIARGDTIPATIAQINLSSPTNTATGFFVDSWGNVIYGDTNRLRVIYGQATNQSGATNPLTAYLESLYFGTYTSGTNTIAVGVKYLSKACIDNASGNSGSPCSASGRFTGVTAPIPGNVYILAGLWSAGSTPTLPTTTVGGGSSGLNNDFATVVVSGGPSGSQYYGVTSAMEGQFPLSVTFNSISSITEDSSGNIYLVDYVDHVLRAINVGSSAITVAGVNIPGYSVGTVVGALGVTGVAGQVGSNCTYMTFMTSGTAGCTGVSQTVTTAPNYSSIGSSALSPIATSASAFQLMGPTSVYVDQWGNIYIGQNGTGVTDGNSKGIYVIYAGGSNAVTGSGNPLNNTLGILYGSSNVIQNDVYLLAGNGLISRNVYYQWIPAAAGYGNTTSATGFSQPQYMVADGAGNLYFADQSTDHSVYRLDAASAHIALIAGDSGATTAPSAYSAASSSAPVTCVIVNALATVGGTNTSAKASNPFGDGCSTYGVAVGIANGIALDSNGDVLFADAGFNVIHSLQVGNVFGSASSPLSVNTQQWLHVHYYGNNLPSTLSTPYSDDFTISGAGAAAFTLGTPSCTANTKDVSMTASSTNGAYTGGSYDCYVPVTFNAATYGSTTATLTAVTSNGINGTILLTGYASGTGLLTSTTAIAAPATATPSQTVTVTITVSGSGAIPTGTVTLTATPSGGSATTLLSAVSLNDGAATYAGVLPVGTDSLIATYSGDMYYNASTSSAAIVTVANASSGTTLTTSSNSVVPGQALTLTATVVGSGATPTGTVTFSSTSTGQDQGILAVVPMVNGVATYYGLIWVGTDTVTATYSGDSNYAPSTSNTTTVVNASVTGQLSFNWPYLSFGQSVAYGASSGVWPVTLQNLSGATIAVPSISLSGAGAANFVIGGNACTTSLAQGATCMFNVTFSPATGGSATGAVTSATLTASTSTSANYTATLAVSGIAVSNSLVYNWPFVNFQPQIAGANGTNLWAVTVTNLTNQALTGVTYNFTGVTNYQSGAFTLSNTCSTIAAGASCTFSINTTPLSAQPGGAYSANLVVSGTAGARQYNSPSLLVSGTVIAGGYAINWNQDQQIASDASGKTYSTIDFGPNNVSTVTSSPWPITVYNNTPSTQTMTITPSLGVFSVANSTCTSVPSGGSCSFNLLFTATAVQTYRGTLQIAGGGYSYNINTWGQATTKPGGTGMVYEGANPVSGAQVYLLAAGNSGYGSASTSLITKGSSGSSSIGQYVLTDSTGAFGMVGDYTCTAGTQVYVLSVGGNPGVGQSNAALELMTALGTCPASGNFTFSLTSVTVNETTTVAAVYALSGYMTDATHVSSSSTALSKTGMANAFITAGNLVNISTGVPNSVSPSTSTGAVPQAEIDTLANILASCGSTAGSVVASPATPCYNLFNATNTGTMPTNTLQAALNIAHAPSNNVSTLYQLATAPVFTPTLNTAPNDWTVGITYSSYNFGLAPVSIAIDGSGNVWSVAQDLNTVNELNNQGAPTANSPYSGLSLPTQVAVDTLGNAWVTNSVAYGPTYVNLGVAEIPASGSAVNNYTTGGINLPLSLALDASNNVWVANQSVSGGNVSRITNAGAAFTSNVGPFGGSEEDGVESIAIDPSGNAWTTTFYNTLNRLNGTTGNLSYSNTFSTYTLGQIAIDSSDTVWIADPVDGIIALTGTTGSLVTGAPFTGGGMQNVNSIALDGAGNVWAASYQAISIGCTGYVSGLTKTGTAITSSTGYTTSVLNTETGGCVYSLAVDGSGNIWVGGPQTITEFVGAAVPVQTPITPTALAVRP